MAEPLRAAVVGLGIGKTHAAKYLELDDVELVGLCDTDGDALKEACDRTGVEQGFTDPEALFDQAKPDVVNLCTPPRSHLSITEAAARRGIHLLVEKPMAWSPEDADGMIRACEAHGVVLMVGHKKVFAPPLVRLKELLDGDLGPARLAVHRYPHPGLSNKAWFWSEEDGRGPIFENAVHAAYTLRFLLGEPERVSAEGGTLISHQYAPQIDGAVATIRFRSGAVASLAAGMVGVRGLRSEDYYVSTEKGVAEASGPFDNLDTLRYALRDDPENVVEETYPDSDPFMEEIRHFLDCVRSGGTPAVTGEDGRKAIELCLAVKEAVTRGAPVEM
jgi:predicted dehydrogenase